MAIICKRQCSAGQLQVQSEADQPKLNCRGEHFTRKLFRMWRNSPRTLAAAISFKC